MATTTCKSHRPAGHFAEPRPAHPRVTSTGPSLVATCFLSRAPWGPLLCQQLSAHSPGLSGHWTLPVAPHAQRLLAAMDSPADECIPGQCVPWPGTPLAMPRVGGLPSSGPQPSRSALAQRPCPRALPLPTRLPSLLPTSLGRFGQGLGPQSGPIWATSVTTPSGLSACGSRGREAVPPGDRVSWGGGHMCAGARTAPSSTQGLQGATRPHTTCTPGPLAPGLCGRGGHCVGPGLSGECLGLRPRCLLWALRRCVCRVGVGVAGPGPAPCRCDEEAWLPGQTGAAPWWPG